jgi:sugar lactone lactonase YvrE
VYVASLGNSEIVKLDTDGNQTVFSSGGNLSGPDGLAFDASGNLYVATSATTRSSNSTPTATRPSSARAVTSTG